MTTELQHRVSESRGAGRVTVALIPRPPGEPAQAADAAALHVGATPIGKGWLECGDSQAQTLVRAVFAYDQAYKVRCMSDAKATELANEFFALVPRPTRILTNMHHALLGEFMPVTAATFSFAIVTVGAAEAAILVVADED